MTDAAASAAPPANASFIWTRRHVVALTVLCPAWMVNAYMVPFGGFLLLGGRAGDVLGRRRVLLAGTAVFTAASLGSALASGPTVMILTRAVQGLAAGFVIPMTLALLTTVFPAGPARNLALGVWA